jgi:hypothetical protein
LLKYPSAEYLNKINNLSYQTSRNIIGRHILSY